jgi:predicted PurR-regulated permease PerM
MRVSEPPTPVIEPRRAAGTPVEGLTATPDLARTTLSLVALAAMIVGTLWVLRPFLAAVIWATMIVVATWPLMRAAQARLGGRRSLAVTVMTLALLLGLMVPLAVAIAALVINAEVIVGWVTSLGSLAVSAPPPWVERLPAIGPEVSARWQQLAAHPEQISARLVPYARSGVGWSLGLLGSVAALLVQLLLIVAIAAMLYARGEQGAAFLVRFARRLAGMRGERAIHLAGQAIRSVAVGILVTAFVQTALAAVGLVAAGVPFPGLLTAAITLLCIAQLGPLLVMAPAAGWLYWKGDPAWGTALLVWTLIVSALDNVLRPILIRRGAQLPLPLIIVGVIGGLIGFGIVGLFVGPVVLAVTYTLLVDWVGGGEAEAAGPPLGRAPGTGPLS